MKIFDINGKKYIMTLSTKYTCDGCDLIEDAACKLGKTWWEIMQYEELNGIPVCNSKNIIFKELKP